MRGQIQKEIIRHFVKKDAENERALAEKEIQIELESISEANNKPISEVRKVYGLLKEREARKKGFGASLGFAILIVPLCILFFVVDPPFTEREVLLQSADLNSEFGGTCREAVVVDVSQSAVNTRVGPKSKTNSYKLNLKFADNSSLAWNLQGDGGEELSKGLSLADFFNNLTKGNIVTVKDRKLGDGIASSSELTLHRTMSECQGKNIAQGFGS